MTVIKRFIDGQWTAVVVGREGPPGVETAAVAPSNLDVLWADTSEPGDAVIPVGGATGQSLVKASGSDYDTGWASSGVPVGGATGQVLAKTSASDYATGWRWNADAVPFIMPDSGRNSVLPLGCRATGGTSAPTNNDLTFFLCAMPQGLQITGVDATCTVGAAASATGRIGFYSMTSATNILPGALIYESATFAADTTGTKSITGLTITTSFPFVWVCAVINSSGATGTWRSITVATDTPFSVGGSPNVLSDIRAVPFLSSVTGAFPNPANFPNWTGAVNVTGATRLGVALTYGAI